MVIDNYVPQGDGLTTLEGAGGKVGPASTAAAVVIIDALVVEVVGRLKDRRITPLVNPTMNVTREAEAVSKIRDILSKYPRRVLRY